MPAQDIIIKHRLYERDWTHKGFHGVLHTFVPVAENAFLPLKEYFGDCNKIIVFYFDGTQGNWFWNNEDLDRLRERFIAKVKDDKRYIKKIRKDWELRLKDFIKFSKKISKARLRKLNDLELVDLYKNFYKKYIEEYSISLSIQDAFSMRSEEFLEPAFRIFFDKKKLDFNEHYGRLMSPIELSFLQQEEIDLMKIAIKEKKGEDISKDIARHVRNYHYINNNYAKVVKLDKKYFLEKVTSMIKNDNLEADLSELISLPFRSREEKKGLMKQLRLMSDLKLYVKITESFAAVQDKRKRYVLFSNYYQSLFMHEIARRSKNKIEDIEFSYFNETQHVLAGKVGKDEFRARRECCIGISTEHGFSLYSGSTAREIIDSVFTSKSDGKDVVEGMIACSGYAKGIAKIVMKTHDLANFAQGDILISSMTRPEMTIAMKKAAAIVTDEGGITSHAAVVSRELKIPCIIGTKHATKIFKDGDLVEVDANSGIVRRI